MYNLEQSDLSKLAEAPNIYVSCAGLIRIICDDKYLLLRNKTSFEKRKETIFTPVGGAYELSYLQAVIFGRTFGIKPRNYEKGYGELRLTMEGSRAQEMIDWFARRQSRELNPVREARQELWREGGLLRPWELAGARYDFVGSWAEITGNRFDEFDKKPNLRMIEVFESRLGRGAMEKLSKLQDNPAVRWVSEEEIMRGETIMGESIGSNAKALISYQKIDPTC